MKAWSRRSSWHVQPSGSWSDMVGSSFYHQATTLAQPAGSSRWGGTERRDFFFPQGFVARTDAPWNKLACPREPTGSLSEAIYISVNSF